MGASKKAHNACKIFIVDDDEQQAGLMQEMAKTAHLEATAYTDSREFLSASITQYDIVVLDLQIPDIDGIEIMRELAAQNIKPHFILVSGFDERVLHSARQLAESKQLNVTATLSKPIKAKKFITLLKQTHHQREQEFLQAQSKAVNNLSAVDETHLQTKQEITIDELKMAIRRHELTVHFQPVVSFTTQQLVSAEVLVRWMHPVKGLLFPDLFIPIAEEHNLMNLLTEEVLILAIKEYHKLTANNIHINVSINLSAQNIYDLAMPEKLEALIKNNHIKTKSFILEVTESAMMNELSNSLDILNRLRMKGFSLSLDDFGSGYSSLIKLYQAPFSDLKIDQHFVMSMLHDPDAKAIIKICMLLAKELNMLTTAEGVETEEIWKLIKNMGCDHAQGNFISRPLSTEEFCLWVKSGRGGNPSALYQD